MIMDDVLSRFIKDAPIQLSSAKLINIGAIFRASRKVLGVRRASDIAAPSSARG